MSLEEILWFFTYDKDNARLVWRNHYNKSARTMLIGREAGTKHKHGYKVVRINNRDYFIHRLIYAIEHGVMPEFIDHINGERSDNRIENLRAATKRLNGQNLPRHRVGMLVGASFDKSRGMWSSNIWYNGKKKFLGRYNTEEEAHQMYMIKLKEINTLLEDFA